MKFKTRDSRPASPAADTPDVGMGLKPRPTPSVGSPEPPASDDTLMVQHGIHTVSYPAAGMTVRQVRERLRTVINIDPGSVAVVNGQPVVDENEHVLATSEQILSFVKKSAVKGTPDRVPRGRRSA